MRVCCMQPFVLEVPRPTYEGAALRAGSVTKYVSPQFHFLWSVTVRQWLLEIQSRARGGWGGLLLCPTTGICKQHPHLGPQHSSSLTPHTFPPTCPVWGISSSLVPFRRWGAPRCLFTCLMAFNIVFTKLVLDEGSADRAMQGGLTGRMHIH